MAHTITRQYVRQLSSQDFALMAQENKHYEEIVRALRSRVEAYEERVHQMEKRIRLLNNEKEQYRIKWQDASRRLQHSNSVTAQLQSDYQCLSEALQHHQPTNNPQIRQPDSSRHVEALQKRLDELTEHNSLLEQELSLRDLQHQEMQQYSQQLQSQLLQSKVEHFSRYLQNVPRNHSARQKQKAERSQSFCHSGTKPKKPPMSKRQKAGMI